MRAIKLAVFLLCAIPFVRLFWLGYHAGLGANPIEFVTHSTGFWSLVMLCLTLTVTPLLRLTGWNALIRLRRMLGLYAFFYALAHFVTYVWFDQWFSVQEIAKDIWKRPFITVGFAAFLLMIPLAVTSTNRMVRRLGRRWSTLHLLVYPTIVLGVLHFWWLKQDKNDLAEPYVFAAVTALLLLQRIVARWRQRRAAPPPAAAVSPSGDARSRTAAPPSRARG